MTILILAETGINFVRSDPSNHSWMRPGASWVSPGCLLGASWVPPGASWVSPGCLLVVSCVPPGCLLGAILVRQKRRGPSVRVERPDSCGEISTMCQKTKDLVFAHSGPTNHCLGSHAGVMFIGDLGTLAWQTTPCLTLQRSRFPRCQTHVVQSRF